MTLRLPRPAAPRLPLSQAEFVALVAMLFATIAFSIDSMLPALPVIAAELSPDAPNAAQLILTSFVLGMGVGTLMAGPLSDALGRRPVIMAGAALYCMAALLAYVAPNLETVLLARLLQGLGAAGPRVVALAMVRDQYRGPAMARVVSIAMMFFSLVPAVAPLMGTAIIAWAGWRGTFLAFVVFSVVSILWLGLRQPETLPPGARKPLSRAVLWQGVRQVLRARVVVVSIGVQGLVMGMLFATLSSTQPIFDQVFGRGGSFPLWFALIAVLAGSSSVINARLVVRLGMRAMVARALWGQVLFSALVLALVSTGLLSEAARFWLHLVWTISVFLLAGLTMGNLNALALEPMGAVAGLAASLVGALSTVAAVLLAAPVGLMFDGTVVPLVAGVTVYGGAALALLQGLPHRR